MNILVIMRMVPDAASELQVSGDGRNIDREWIDFQLNDFDDHALEEAILLKEATGARVVAVAIGEGDKRVLQMALARGADEVLALQHEPGSIISSRDIAASCSMLATSKSADLVLCGVQSSEDVFGQLAPYLGGVLGWPFISGSSSISLHGDSLDVRQERGGNLAVVYEVSLPAVIGVQTASKAPRYVSGSKLREASKAAIGQASLAASGFRRSAEITGLHLPQRGGSGEHLGDDADVVADRLLAILSERGLAAV